MDILQRNKDRMESGEGNLGDHERGMQKMADDKMKGDVLREFASEMDTHDIKRMPVKSPLSNVYSMPKEEIKEEPLKPLDFDERLEKFLRD